jgi:tRNA threonylcarbamoyladenosine biosynthesis protein TsaE
MTAARTRSPEGTRAIAEALADVLQPGDVVLLVGGLGSGKTTFVQGLARGLGFHGHVTSPTFTLCHTYSGRIDLVHVDLWRLERTSEILDLGLDEELESGAVVVAEWGEGAGTMLGTSDLVVRFEVAGLGEERDITFEGHGSWSERMVSLSTILATVPA